MLPALYYHLHYNEDGEVLAFWNPNAGECPFEPNILVDLETHSKVQPAPFKYRVRDGKVVSLEELNAQETAPEPEPTPTTSPIDVKSLLIGGLVVGKHCYAVEANALSVLQLDLIRNAKVVRAVTYTKTGNHLVELSREDAKNVASKIAEHLSKLYCG